jgi:hypothetical protein
MPIFHPALILRSVTDQTSPHPEEARAGATDAPECSGARRSILRDASEGAPQDEG